MSRRNKKGRDINGVILLDKATGASSNFVLQQVKRLFFAKKAGHTGSLDPLASGLLPICLGQATKVAQFLLNDDKRYFVRGKLGQISDTGDAEGVITNSGETEGVDDSSIADVLPQFVGNIKQVPPMYSALKRDGKPLYELARQGIEVEREARPVTIYEINYVSLEDDILSLDVACSKGTYIRTLVEDIGKVLGCGAHVIELRRTGFAHFDLTDSITFEQLEALKSEDFDALDAQIFAAETMLPSFDSVFLSAEQTSDIKLGRKVQHGNFVEVQKLKLFDENQQFIGIGESNLGGEVLPKRLFV
ncbi:MAG: tRNA pseudouridine(55) synthase TruB [Gammaproteobacteria bacterium]|nr:tRNA pseudouridine(55) synthase TruB [Gammaproteobacteria bacterium]